jgi:hypothetical protein
MSTTLRDAIANIIHDTLCRYCEDGAGAGAAKQAEAADVRPSS